MKTRQLGKDGPAITTIGFGAWAIGGPWRFGWGKQDDRESIAAIRKAIDLGINWIDTAAVYGLGHSEELVKKALNGVSEDVFIATKCGQVWDNNRKITINLRPESIRKEVDNSLQRLGVEVIDLYQFHWPDPKTPTAEAWGEMVRLQESGKIRYIGVSNFSVQQLEECMKIAPVQSLQPPYSIIRRDYEADVLPYCRQHGIGVIVYSPMQAGLLTGKFSPDQLAPDDWRHRSPEHTEPKLGKNLELVDRLKPIAEKYNKTVGQLAIAWTLMNPAVTAAIVGARNPDQVQENVKGAGWQIDTDDMNEIQRLYETILGTTLP